MFKLTCTLNLLMVLAFFFSSQSKPFQVGAMATHYETGKPKLINPAGKTPFPYNLSVDKAVIDQSGNIWFGTSEGVYRYDGKLFVKYTTMAGLSIDHVSALLLDKQGNLWVSAHGGLVYCRSAALHNSSVTQFYRVKLQPAKSFGFITNTTASITPDDKNIVTHILQDQNESIWFCFGYNVYRTDVTGDVAITTAIGDFLKSEKTQYNCTYPDDFGICGIYEDKQGNILISTSACSCGPNVTYRLDGKRKKHPCILNTCKHDLQNQQDYADHYKEIAASFIKISTEDGNTKIAFTTALEDKAGNVWIGSDSGIYRYDGTHFTHFTHGDVLSKSVVNTIYQDHQGIIWFGTAESANFRGNGIFRYHPTSAEKTGNPLVTQFTSSEGLCSNGTFKSNIVSAITEDNNGKIWVTGDGGACYFNGVGFTSLTNKDGFTSQPVKCMMKDKAGNLWFGTWELGLYRYNGKSLVSYTEYKPAQ